MPTPTTCQPFKFILIVIDEHTLGAISPTLAIDRSTLAYSVAGPPPLPLRANVLHASILRGSHLSSHSQVYLSGRRVRLATQEDIVAYGYQASLPGEGFKDSNWYIWDAQQPGAAGEPVLLGSPAWPADAAQPLTVPSATTY